jgi:hypothetical protein
MIDYYILPTEIVSTLRTNSAIEQWIGHKNENDYRLIEWIRIEMIENGRVLAAKFDVFDDGNHDFLDIYEFESVDPDNLFGLSVEFDSIDEALAYATTVWHADLSRFVRGGEIQTIYADFLNEHGLPPK